LGSNTTQLKLEASDGKKYKSDMLDAKEIVMLAKEFSTNQGVKFLEWFVDSTNSLDGKSKQKAYNLFDSNVLDTLEIGSIKGLQQIHSYIFDGLYEFAKQIRTKNISKGDFMFANADYLLSTLKKIEKMPESSFDEIIEKYVEMNIAHPFMEGNGRATRIWLDLILKKSISKCVDWSKVDKTTYLNAMRESVNDSKKIKDLLKSALTIKVNDRELFMKGIDYSYYYEENN